MDVPEDEKKNLVSILENAVDVSDMVTKRIVTKNNLFFKNLGSLYIGNVWTWDFFTKQLKYRFLTLRQ